MGADVGAGLRSVTARLFLKPPTVLDRGQKGVAPVRVRPTVNVQVELHHLLGQEIPPQDVHNHVCFARRRGGEFDDGAGG